MSKSFQSQRFKSCRLPLQYPLSRENERSRAVRKQNSEHKPTLCGKSPPQSTTAIAHHNFMFRMCRAGRIRHQSANTILQFWQFNFLTDHIGIRCIVIHPSSSAAERLGWEALTSIDTALHC